MDTLLFFLIFCFEQLVFVRLVVVVLLFIILMMTCVKSCTILCRIKCPRKSLLIEKFVLSVISYLLCTAIIFMYLIKLSSRASCSIVNLGGIAPTGIEFRTPAGFLSSLGERY